MGVFASSDDLAIDLDELAVDLVKGLIVIGQILRSTWWEWSSGSSLIFWRWNGRDQIRAARDGMPIFVQKSLAGLKRKKAVRFDPSVRGLVAGKIQAMWDKSYLEKGSTASLLHYFAVPKGDSDIRVVFDGTFSGLNDNLWSPNFFLPTARHAGELLDYDSWMSDMDFGEFFHNFHMDEKIRRHSGIDVSCLNLQPPRGSTNGSDNHKGSVVRWSRLFMGSKPSPYTAVRHYYWAEEFAQGSRLDKANPMGYDTVLLNLPGMRTYDPNRPRVMKWDTANKCIAGDVVTFVDDVRITGSSKEVCWAVYRQFRSRTQYLGLQNAPRKFRPPSQEHAGAWTGTIFRVGTDAVSKTVSLEKWSKGRDILQSVSTFFAECDRPELDRKNA